MWHYDNGTCREKINLNKKFFRGIDNDAAAAAAEEKDKRCCLRRVRDPKFFEGRRRNAFV